MRQPARSKTTIAIALALCALLTSTVLTFVGCAQNSVASTPDGIRLLAVKGVRDVTTAATTANKAGYLSTPLTAQVLTVNKQVLDVIEANPSGWKAIASTALRNTRDGLPADVKTAIGPYLDAVALVIDRLQQPNMAVLERGGH